MIGVKVILEEKEKYYLYKGPSTYQNFNTIVLKSGNKSLEAMFRVWF